MSNIISDAQRAQNAALHKSDPNFGNRATASGFATNLNNALKRMHELGACNSILDYGTGKGKLVRRLRQELPETIFVSGYDPAVTEWEKMPDKKFDIVTSFDVLEHIEPNSIDSVFSQIKELTSNFCYLVVDLQPAVKRLPDGRNAHILLAPYDWWVTKTAQYFLSQASFPVLHERGIPQKLVIAATNKPEFNTLMYSFIMKLKLDFKMTGGPLGTRKI